MIKSFRISFSLRNTCRVNGILYALKQIPLLGRLLPGTLYGSGGLKIFAAVLAVIWEILSAFLGKLIYLAAISVLCGFYGEERNPLLFLHVFFFLTIIGAYLNTYLFNPTNEKYYAVILMRMDAGLYTLSNYCYSMLRTIIGFFPAVLLFGSLYGVPVWLCILLPFFVAGAKLTAASALLLRYEKTGKSVNENMPPKLSWTLTALLLAAAFGLPCLNALLPLPAVLILVLLGIAAGLPGAVRIARFPSYREICQLLLAEKKYGTDYTQAVKKANAERQQKMISPETGITSSKKGFEYFNELFIKRHRKILWRSAERIALILLAVTLGVLLLIRINPELRGQVNRSMSVLLPYFAFVMYLINRGTIFTAALFMNCDHSMLTYSFYKKPGFILKLFRIRLREIIKINLLPAAVIGAGLTAVLYFSGGTENLLNYVIFPLTVIVMSIFFSVHYLTLYYLLQPYNIHTQVKSGAYTAVIWITYMVCWLFLQLRLDTLAFGLAATAFCIVYCIAACILVYKLAYKTFRLRS